MRLDCEQFRAGVTAFLGDGLGAVERAAFQDHLDACPDCAAGVASEAAFDRALRERSTRAPAPAGLEDRVRAALREAAGASAPRVPWWRRAWVATAAAVVLLGALLVASPFPSLAPVPGTVVLSGTIVDHDCDRHGLDPVVQRGCEDVGHRNVLKLADGRYVRFSEADHRDGGRWSSPEARGVVVEVRGRYVPSRRTIRIEDVRGL